MELFEKIKRVNEHGQEVWYAHELAKALKYRDYRNFENAIYKAMESCKNSGNEISDHFGEITEQIPSGKGALQPVKGFQLSRYACYLIVMNGDSSKEVIALGQTYFAVQTRRQELVDEFEQLTEESKRIAVRSELASHNSQLADAAHAAGVVTSLDYAIFQNEGYKGLYGGLTAKDIHIKKGLKKSQQILDHMGSEELAANLFRATQAEAKLRRDKIKGKLKANLAHFEVGAKVRRTIRELGGTMPENLPTPNKSIQQLKKEQTKRLKTEK